MESSQFGVGETSDARQLFTTLYRELKRIARKQLAGSSSMSLSTTGLVHEVYLKLFPAGGVNVHNRAHFFSLAARAMRQIVIDRARARTTEKRGGDATPPITLERVGDIIESDMSPEEVLRLNEALKDLQESEPRLAAVVELRFFAGLTMVEIAEIQGVGARTLDREWRRAKAYLFDALGK